MTGVSLKRLKCDVGIVGSGPVGLVLSTLLSRYGVQHVILDRKLNAAEHPQAHFLHARTMEIIQSYMGDANKSIINALPPSDYWRDFSYSHSLCGTELHRVNHFMNASKEFWLSTPSNVAHLAQNRVERTFRLHVDATIQGSSSAYLRGYNVTNCSVSKDSTTISAESCSPATEYGSVELECKYLVGADGSNSFIRRSLGITMEGEEAMQYLMNVHFTCPGLRPLLQPRPAMLYFVFNEAMVAVFVAHDATTDEWVCQIPYFPPFQSPEDFTEIAVQKLLAATIASSTSKLNPSSRHLPVTINSINSWIMHAQVASQYGNIRSTPKSRGHGNVFLVGDAAHRFPPAGGFGMNTGIQDAHNLAWKLALANKGLASPEILTQTYDQERRPTAQAITALSKYNYGLTAGLASSLGVDPALATAAVNASDSAASRALLPFAVRRTAVLGALRTGLYTLKWLQDWDNNVLGSVRVRALRKLIDGGRSLPLIFPEADLDYRYNAGGVVREPGIASAPVIRDRTSGQAYAGSVLQVGSRVPHCWLVPLQGNSPTAALDVGVDMKHAISTVQLPALVDRLNGLPANAISAADQASICVPMCSILVSKHNAADMVAALQKMGSSCSKLFCVVSVDGAPATATSGATMTPLNHTALQEMYQDPFYRIESDTQRSASKRVESLEGSMTFDARFQQVLDRQETPTWYSREGGVARLNLRDISGRWMTQLQQYQRQQQKRPTAAAADVQYLAVIVRPDGHVAHVVSVDPAGSAEARVQACEAAIIDVAKVLHLTV